MSTEFFPELTLLDRRRRRGAVLSLKKEDVNRVFSWHYLKKCKLFSSDLFQGLPLSEKFYEIFKSSDWTGL